MKRKELLNYLYSRGCEFVREGEKHSWWYNPDTHKRSAIPRHNEIAEILAEKICKDLGVPPVEQV